MLRNIMNFFNKEKPKISKTIKNNYLSTKSFDIVDIKSIITKHLKTSHKLSKTIRQAEKVGFKSSLCSDTKKTSFSWK